MTLRFDGSHPVTVGLTSASVGTAENRWTGGNRSGWHDPEYDALADALSKALERSEHEQHIARMVQILTDNVQSINVQNVAQPWIYEIHLQGLGEAMDVIQADVSLPSLNRAHISPM